MFYLPPDATVWAIASLAGCLAYHLVSREGGAGRRAAAVMLAIARVAGGLVMWTALGAKAFSTLSLPLVWVAAVPRTMNAPAGGMLARWLLASLAVMQTLQAYPVAGSQIGWGTFLLVPCGGVCLADGLRDCARWSERLARPTLVRAAAWAFMAACLVWVIHSALLLPSLSFTARYRGGVPMEVPGAERVRAPVTTAATYRWLADEIDRRCETFITLPGMNSLYLFTGREPPTMLNATAWMQLFDDARQEHVVRQVEAIPGLCVVRNQRLVSFWTRKPRNGPLERYIAERFRTVASHGDYDIMMRNDSVR
jgi:hypothetical protein